MESLLVTEKEKSTVVDDFRNQINPWCAMTAKANKIPEEQMCQIAIQVFGEFVSVTRIRDCIEPKYKVSYKSHNASQKKSTKSQKLARLYKYAKSLGFDVVKSMQDSSQPFYETIVLVTKEDNKNA